MTEYLNAQVWCTDKIDEYRFFPGIRRERRPRPFAELN